MQIRRAGSIYFRTSCLLKSKAMGPARHCESRVCQAELDARWWRTEAAGSGHTMSVTGSRCPPTATSQSP